MPWTYHQATGLVRHDGRIIERGYSGSGHSTATGRNNPAMEAVKGQGPIPRGQWKIGPAYPHKTKGPVVMNLDPIGHSALGRSEFRIHGNNSKNDASEGCIILSRHARDRIAASSDRTLTVYR